MDLFGRASQPSQGWYEGSNPSGSANPFKDLALPATSGSRRGKLVGMLPCRLPPHLRTGSIDFVAMAGTTLALLREHRRCSPTT